METQGHRFHCDGLKTKAKQVEFITIKPPSLCVHVCVFVKLYLWGQFSEIYTC